MKIIIISLIAFGSVCHSKEEVLFDYGEQKKVEEQKPLDVPKKTVKKKNKKPVQQLNEVKTDQAGNLPDYYLERDMKNITKHSSNQIMPSNAKQILEKVSIGDTFDALINHHILVFNGEKSPVMGIVTSGALKGYRVLGEATLNDANESVSIEFKAISRKGQNYTTAATALNEIGQTYFTGKYYSNEAGLFAGTFIATFAAAYFDGLVPRNTNYFGQVQTDNSVDSAFKKGMSGAALETAEIFKERLKKAKSFVEIKQPIKIKILINDNITEK